MDAEIENLNNLIYSIARSFTNDEELIKDLYQEAIIGIINAKKNYDKNSGAKFSTYARMYIYGEIFKYFNGDKSFKVNKEIVKMYKLILKTNDLLSQELKKVPTISEIANYLGTNEETIQNTIMVMKSTLSLDHEFDEDDSSNMYNFIKTSDSYNDLFFEELFEGLTEEEKNLIKCRYVDGYSQSETASIMNMSQSGVSRMEKESINKMRVRTKEV